VGGVIQLTLFEDMKDPKLERFEEFHSQNPQVYAMLVREARRLRAVGHRRYSIQALFEIVRWHRALETTDDTGFKLSNDFKPFYARLIDRNEEDLHGFFVLKRTKWGEL
jgi:hypothetical protein